MSAPDVWLHERERTGLCAATGGKCGSGRGASAVLGRGGPDGEAPLRLRPSERGAGSVGFKCEAIPSKIRLDSPEFIRATPAAVAQCLRNVGGSVALEAEGICRKPGVLGGG